MRLAALLFVALAAVLLLPVWVVYVAVRLFVVLAVLGARRWRARR